MKIHEAFPYLRVRGAEKALAFYCDAFGVKEKFRLVEPSGRIGHAELEFGDVTIMVSEEFPEHGITGPASLGGTSVGLHLHVDDCDAMIARMVDKGATVIRPPSISSTASAPAPSATPSVTNGSSATPSRRTSPPRRCSAATRS